MQDVIKRIIKIEEKAQEIIKDTNNEKEKKLSDFDEKIRILEKRIMDDAEKKIAEIRTREMADNDIVVSEQKEKCSNIMMAMEEQVRKNQDAWVDELVASVLKR